MKANADKTVGLLHYQYSMELFQPCLLWKPNTMTGMIWCALLWRNKDKRRLHDVNAFIFISVTQKSVNLKICFLLHCTAWDSSRSTEIKNYRFSVIFRGISRKGSVFFFLQWYKLAHICIHATSLHSPQRWRVCIIQHIFSEEIDYAYVVLQLASNAYG